MAGGLARVTGEPGVFVTIPGPGFMWGLTGVAEALLDSVPLVHIAGAPIDEPAGRLARQQELAQAEIAAPLVKAIVEADSYADPGAATLDAFRLARSGEPGPVLLHVSSSALGRMFDASNSRSTSEDEFVARPPELHAVIARVLEARRPAFIVGQGANPHGDLVRQLVERLNAPLLATGSARGLIPEDHPLSFAFGPFVASIPALNALFESCDLIVAIACKLGHGSTGGFNLRLPADRLVHVDASPDVVGANYPASLGVVADARDLLEKLISSDLRPSAWTTREIESWRAKVVSDPADAREPFVGGTEASTAKEFFESLRRALPDDAILVLDSGLHQMLARRYYRVRSPAGLIMPADLQSMGFAIPTAIGARLGAPNRTVVALVGDGGFAMTGLELLSAVREELSMVVVVFVDGALGQIRMQQLANYGATHGVRVENPNLELFAAAVGAHYERVGDTGLDALLKNAVERSGVTLVEVPVGDTLKIRGHAALVRTSEATRRLVRPRLFRALRALFRWGR
jgi:acetolactate synthase-1/2/3 large subunit